jgi:hypothetical protein
LLHSDDKCNSDKGFNEQGKVSSVPADHAMCIDTRNRVYLVLATPLGDNEEPLVQSFGGRVQDVAGNTNVTVEAKAKDRVAPTLDIDVSGDVTTDGRPLAQEDVTVQFESGELLIGIPTVWLVAFDQNGKISESEYEIQKENARVTPGTNEWTAEFDGDDETRVAAIIIRAQDRENVTITDGWDGDGVEPMEDDQLDLVKLEKAGLLVEFDFSIPAADITINPHESGAGNEFKTDSVNPFIELEFAEGTENTITVGTDDDAETFNSRTVKNVKTNFDNYRSVTLTALTVDGEDVLEQAARVESYLYDLALSNLTVGDHTLEYTAEDTAGNEVTKKQDFEVLPRKGYEVALRPGWNLVSFPGDPVDTAIDSVLPADHPATDVLAYDAGLWTSAARGEGNVWEGDLTDIDGQHAYWINSTKTDTLAAVLIEPGTGEASRPPAFPLIVGWNLIPVTDLDQGPAGERMHDDYFTSMLEDDFVRGYVFNAQSRRWERLGYMSEVSNGQGVWVYSRSNVVLVP